MTVPLHQGTVPLFWVHQILSKIYDTQPHLFWNSQLIRVRNMRDRTKNLGFTNMTSQRGVESQNILLILAPICFLWNKLWSVCRYITGPISGCSSQDGTSQQHLTAPIWKCMSGIGDHRFNFFMDLHSNYTLYTNLTIFSIMRLLMEDVTSLIVFNQIKVEKIMQYRLMPV